MMSKRTVRWGYPAILFIVIELFCWSGFMYASGEAGNRKNLSASGARLARSGAICSKDLNKKECKAERDQDEDRVRAIAALVAQESATNWAWWSALLAGLQVPISLAGIFAVVMTIKQGQIALLQDREFAESDLRPWLRLSANICRGQINGGVITADIEIRLSNVGRTVAVNVQTFRDTKSYSIDGYKSVLASLRKPPRVAPIENGFPVLPGDEETVTMFYQLRFKDLCFRDTHIGRIAMATIAVWCDYQWGNGKTGRMLRLYQLGIMLGDDKHFGLPEQYLNDGQVNLVLELQYGSEVE